MVELRCVKYFSTSFSGISKNIWWACGMNRVKAVAASVEDFGTPLVDGEWDGGDRAKGGTVNLVNNYNCKSL